MPSTKKRSMQAAPATSAKKPQAETKTAKPPQPARAANGDPNIAGDWASEQRVMTDPRGQSGTLVPVSVASEFTPGEVPEGQQAFPGARGTAVSLAEDPVDNYWNQRGSALPTADLTLRKLAAIEALARHGRARKEMLDSITIDPPLWPTSALVDWIGILQRVPSLPQRDPRLRQRGVPGTVRRGPTSGCLRRGIQRDDRGCHDLGRAALLALPAFEGAVAQRAGDQHQPPLREVAPRELGLAAAAHDLVPVRVGFGVEVGVNPWRPVRRRLPGLRGRRRLAGPAGRQGEPG